MCACEDGDRCIYHNKMLKDYQEMWKALMKINKGEVEEDIGNYAGKVIESSPRYLHL